METPKIYEQASSEYYYNNDKTVEHRFKVEDLLDLPNDDVVNVVSDQATLDNVTGNSTDTTSSAVTLLESCNSSFSGNEPRVASDFSDAHFSNDLCVPYDDLAELEWLSNFVEESFSSEDLQKLHLISGKNARSNDSSETHQSPPENNRGNTPIFRSDVSVPGKARSKRSRAAPCSWSSRLSVLSSTTNPALWSESDSGFTSSTPKKACKAIVFPKKKDVSGSGGDGRRCLHCATDKTPQWRTGPMGPKTLCNACGVRYKSGRLVPEYRPAASPTFVLTKHSNSHRKVLELRRQKEMHKPYPHQQQQQQYLHHNMMFDVSNGGEDYLIHQHIGPDYRHLI